MAVKKKYIVVAVDEAGRGPLAGPIAVAAVAAKGDSRLLKGIRDSKKFSAKQRNEWLEILKDNFEYKVAMVGSQTIDRIGINRAIRLAVARVLRKFSRKLNLVLLDGLLHAPKHYNQKTLIKGDEKIPLISAASIIAKVYRDKKMERLHKTSPEYCFNQHKGYGTKLHYKMLKKNGVSDQHRRYYLRNWTKNK